MKAEDFIILNFAEAKQPEYREKKGVGYIEFGFHNDYPDYLIELYRKSAKHNAIIKGKVNYITGNGWRSGENDPAAEAFIKAPNEYESLAELTRKISMDIEIFGGAYLEIIWSVVGGQIASVTHVDYSKIRTSQDNTSYWYKANGWKERKGDIVPIPAFNTNVRQGKQIFYVREYQPDLDAYALPGYMGSLNYIESDIEVSKHVLSNAQTGFSASKLITLPNGEPSPEEKWKINRRFEDNFSGSDGKKFILSFVSDPARKPIIDDLGASDLTKEDFGRVDTMIQQNIYSGHGITSPALFGIAEPGKLGSRNEMRDAYEVFKNTYVNDKQKHLEQVFNRIARINGAISEISIIPVEPITYELSEASILTVAPREWILEKAGIDPNKYQTSSVNLYQKITDGINSLSPLVANKVLEHLAPNELRGIVGLLPKEGGDQISTAGTEPSATGATGMVNENLKSMTGRQWQQMARIVREFSKGKITREQASMMLKSGYGLSDDEVFTMLGEPEQFSEDASDEDIIGAFAEYGESVHNFSVVKNSPIKFADVRDEADKKILSILDKEPLTPHEDIAKALKVKVADVSRRIAKMLKMRILVEGDTGGLKPSAPLAEIIDEPAETTFEIRYSYEWKPDIPRSERDTPEHPSRAFCRKLMSLERFYTRRDIETLSQRLGYSVFDRAGGWWGQGAGKPASPSCRHEWRSNVVTRKKKA